ncbi:hypothetical protein O3P69_001458 [Scylla paramamosain]|uniref:Uncharacterized protein n=1 Tax=Scylla paramamosain TaxID=85552 RepID=A0AAW0UXK3_SCYPA
MCLCPVEACSVHGEATLVHNSGGAGSAGRLRCTVAASPHIVHQVTFNTRRARRGGRTRCDRRAAPPTAARGSPRVAWDAPCVLPSTWRAGNRVDACLRSHGGDSCCKGEAAEERVREVVRGSVEAAGQCMGGAAPHPAINWRDGRCSLLTQTTSEKVQQERGLFVMPRRGCVTGGDVWVVQGEAAPALP